jgi:molybdenum-dependent DNA-binding transcriptional regulator ModE
MSRRIDWESQIGRQLRLRDLHAFFTVIRSGSMAKAATELGVSQPAVSKVIADLEHALGVRLLDRSPRGVEPTVYGHALLKRGDDVTWQAYGENLEEKLKDLHDKVHRGSYRARPARRTYIPKMPGAESLSSER